MNDMKMHFINLSIGSQGKRSVVQKSIGELIHIVFRILMLFCEDVSLHRGMRGLKMIVPDSNPAACQFCEHCGFTLQGIDRYALLSAPSERDKPAAARACALLFYRPHQKG